VEDAALDRIEDSVPAILEFVPVVGIGDEVAF
jgi:hypothetical protein